MKFQNIIFIIFLVNNFLSAQSWIHPNPIRPLDNLEINDYKIGEEIPVAHYNINNKKTIYVAYYNSGLSTYPQSLNFYEHITMGKYFSIAVLDNLMIKEAELYSDNLGFSDLTPNSVIAIYPDTIDSNFIWITGEAKDLDNSLWIWRIKCDYNLNIFERFSFDASFLGPPSLPLKGISDASHNLLVRTQIDIDNNPSSQEDVKISKFNSDGLLIEQSPILNNYQGWITKVFTPFQFNDTVIIYPPAYILNETLDTTCTFFNPIPILSKHLQTSKSVLPYGENHFLVTSTEWDAVSQGGVVTATMTEKIEKINISNCDKTLFFQRTYTLDHLNFDTYPGLFSSAILDSNHIYMCNTRGGSVYFPDESDEQTLMVTSINALGETNWWVAFGGEDYGYAAAHTFVTDEGGVLILVTRTEELPSTYISQADMYYVRLDIDGNVVDVTDTYENQLTSSSILCYPNPTNGYFTLEISPQIKKPTCLFFDIRGVLIKEIVAESALNNIDTSAFPRGVYFYKVVSDRGVLGSGKIVLK